MRSYLATILAAAGACVMAAAMASPPPPPPTLNVVEYHIETAYARFHLSPDVSEALTTPLIFEVQVNSVQDFLSSDIALNGRSLPVVWDRTSAVGFPTLAVAAPSNHLFLVKDTSGHDHTVDLSVTGSTIAPHNSSSFDDHIAQKFTIHIRSIDETRLPAFAGILVITQPTASPHLKKLVSLRVPEVVDFDAYAESFMVAGSTYDGSSADVGTIGVDDDFDIDSEIESLLRLETQAKDLETQIAAKKARIAQCLKTHRDHVSLRHLLEQCDGLLCAAKAIAQRICDKVGLVTEPSLDFVKVQNVHAQHLITFEGADEKPQQTSRNSTKSGTSSPAKQPLTSAHTASASTLTDKELDWRRPILRILGIVAAGLGLVTLAAYIRRKCMSARSRVEQAADLEERRNARAYRRAARRAYMKRRWNAVVTTFSSFRQPKRDQSTADPADYEEKRALILQEAFLEQELDQAEKGEVMEAEIRELRYAHEIVSNLVRVDERRFDLIAPVRDPPPPLVPLPGSRSRASTGTLPSYTSETLPDYTSRLATEVGSSRFSTSSASDDSDSERSTDHVRTDASRRLQSCASSSVIDVSTRPSEDTLRTFRSKHTTDL